MAVSTVYFDRAIDSIPPPFSVSLSIDQTACGVRAVFNHIYTNAGAAAELIDLIHNISQAVRIIKQVHIRMCIYSTCITTYSICMHILVHSYIHNALNFMFISTLIHAYVRACTMKNL